MTVHDVESNPELSRMVLSGVKDAMNDARKVHTDYKVGLDAKVQKQLDDAFAVLFHAFPYIENVTWTHTSGEFDDSSYSGFTIGEIYCMPRPGTQYKGYTYTEASGWVEEILTFDRNNPNSHDNERGIDVSSFIDEEAASLVRALWAFMTTFDTSMEALYGDHVLITVTPDGVQATEYYNND